MQKGKGRENKEHEAITYSVLGAYSIYYFQSSSTIYIVLYGTLFISLYCIAKVLEKYKNIENIKFVSKENIKYFDKK